MNKPKIFNLSNKVLSQQYVSVLHRGLKFTPNSLPNKIELKNDVQQFSEEDESEEEKSFDDSIIKNKPAFNPL